MDKKYLNDLTKEEKVKFHEENLDGMYMFCVRLTYEIQKPDDYIEIFKKVRTTNGKYQHILPIDERRIIPYYEEEYKLFVNIINDVLAKGLDVLKKSTLYRTYDMLLTLKSQEEYVSKETVETIEQLMDNVEEQIDIVQEKIDSEGKIKEKMKVNNRYVKQYENVNVTTAIQVKKDISESFDTCNNLTITLNKGLYEVYVLLHLEGNSINDYFVDVEPTKEINLLGGVAKFNTFEENDSQYCSSRVVTNNNDHGKIIAQYHLETLRGSKVPDCLDPDVYEMKFLINIEKDKTKLHSNVYYESDKERINKFINKNSYIKATKLD